MQKPDKLPKIAFKDYFHSLPLEEKMELRDQLVPKYFHLTTFYQKVAANRFSNLEREKLTEVTGRQFV
jgi:hypothetical protein